MQLCVSSNDGNCNYLWPTRNNDLLQSEQRRTVTAAISLERWRPNFVYWLMKPFAIVMPTNHTCIASQLMEQCGKVLNSDAKFRRDLGGERFINSSGNRAKPWLKRFCQFQPNWWGHAVFNVLLHVSIGKRANVSELLWMPSGSMWQRIATRGDIFRCCFESLFVLWQTFEEKALTDEEGKVAHTFVACWNM